MSDPKPPRLTIHDIPADDRPRERLLALGPDALSNAELLAVLLRSGTAQENALVLAQRVLAHFQDLGRLAQAEPAELTALHGLGTAKAAQVLAALELGRRLNAFVPQARPSIRRAADAAKLMLDMRLLDQEHVRVMLLDSRSQLVAVTTLYVGTLNASVLRVAEVLREAIVRNCPAIILVHNHPGGEALPSGEDVQLTRDLAAAAHLMDITLVDHIIIGASAWCSLRETGQGFPH